MTRVLWIDATHGAAGDMLLGALIDAGAPAERVRADIARLSFEPIGLRFEEVRRHGMRAMRAHVSAGPSTVRRTLSDVLSVLSAAELEPPVTAFAATVFRALAAAEARVHGVKVDQVHFHEVGALDAIADIVGCASALDSLGFLPPPEADAKPRIPVVKSQVVVSMIAVGSGHANSEHGRIPVPAPAVLELLTSAAAPMTDGGQPRELCTPTGAALLTSLATGWGDLPAMTGTAVGVGAGNADPPQHPNVLRVVIGDAFGQEPGAADRTDDLMMIESTIDDLDPRLWPEVLDALTHAGALDAWAAPALMRKGRPGYVVSALAPPDRANAVIAALFLQSTTLGARVYPVARHALAREVVTLDIDGVPVQVKIGRLNGAIITVQPEFADAVAAAQALGLPAKTVLERLRGAAAARLDGSGLTRK